MRPKCLSCEGPGGKPMTVQIDRERYVDAWQIRVCDECRRIFEAMLDQASVGHQWGFPIEQLPERGVKRDR